MYDEPTGGYPRTTVLILLLNMSGKLTYLNMLNISGKLTYFKTAGNINYAYSPLKISCRDVVGVISSFLWGQR
jgi:hypothetical protein